MIDIRNYFAPSVLYPGLQITVQAGIVLVNGSGVLLPTQNVALPANSTSSIYLNTQTAAIQVAGSFPVTNCYPIAVAVTGTGVVNSLIDSRPDIGGVGGGGSGAWSGITNATADLTLANAGFNTTFNQTSATNWTWANTTAATNVTSQSSPILNVNGTYWNGSASALDSWTIQDVIANGTNGASALKFGHTGTSGLATVDVSSASQVVASATSALTSRTGTVQYSFTGDTGTGFGYTGSQQFGFFSSGACKLKYLAPFFELTSDGQIIWNGATNFSSGTWNMNLSVPSAGLLCVGQGTTAGDFTGALKLGALTEDNATAATSGVSQSSPVYTSSGRYWDGAASQIDSWTMQDVVANGTNGTSTLTFTHAGTSGGVTVAAPNLTATNNVFCTTLGSAALPLTAIWVGTLEIHDANAWNSFEGGSGGEVGFNFYSSRVNALFNLNGIQSLGWLPQTFHVGNADVNLSRMSAGNLSLGSGVAGDSSGKLSLGGITGSCVYSQIATTPNPTVAVLVGAGATNWGYKLVAKDALGSSIASSEVTVANAANLTNSAANKITIAATLGAQSYDVYRTTVGTSPNTTGKIGNISTGNLNNSTFLVDAGVITLSSVATASGGTTVYTGTLSNIPANNLVGATILVAGFVTGANNGTFTCTANTTTTLTLNNASGAAETHAATATQAGDATTAPVANTTGTLKLALQVFANNAAAIAGGLVAGCLYRTGGDPDPVSVVH